MDQQSQDQNNQQNTAGAEPPMPSAMNEQQPEQSMPMVGGPAKSGHKKWLWLLIIILLILAALLFGWWWQGRNTGGSGGSPSAGTPEPEPEEVAAICAEGLTNFESETLGLGFCYPAAWGDTAVADAKFAPADTGSRWMVTFASKPEVTFGVVSEDWTTTEIRDGRCSDTFNQTLPAFSPFSATWTTETGGGTEVVQGMRGIQVMSDDYLITEDADSLLTNGVCLRGHKVLGGESLYQHTTATYFVEFDGSSTVQDHIDNPSTLISEANRDDFYAFVKSAYAMEP